MNTSFLVIALVLLASCTSQDKEVNINESNLIRDTIYIEKIRVDTLFVERSYENNNADTDWFIHERLPNWVVESDILKRVEEKDAYEIENSMNPFYLEADFNGDGHFDIALQISHTKTGKVGFIIIHGETNEIHVIGAGTKIKNGLTDDMSYIDIWKINRNKINEPGIDENSGTGEKGTLILNNPSLQIEKSELGGGQIYWNGKEYAYFHQTC